MKVLKPHIFLLRNIHIYVLIKNLKIFTNNIFCKCKSFSKENCNCRMHFKILTTVYIVLNFRHNLFREFQIEPRCSENKAYTRQYLTAKYTANVNMACHGSRRNCFTVVKRVNIIHYARHQRKLRFEMLIKLLTL
jgi:hypothetical protein